MRDSNQLDVFVDIGATRMRFGQAIGTSLFVPALQILRTPRNADDFVTQLRMGIAAATPSRTSRRVTAYISCAGMIGQDGTLLNAINLPAPIPISTRLAQSDCDAFVMNDAQIQAWGAAEPNDSFIYMCFGTGVGGAIVLNGRPHTGERGMAGEIGHLGVALSGPRCLCGRRGCLDQYASGRVLERRMGDRWWSNEALNDDTKRILKRGATATSVTATALSRVLDLRRIIFGGPLTTNPYWRDEVRKALEPHLNPSDVEFVAGTWNTTVRGLSKFRQDVQLGRFGQT